MRILASVGDVFVKDRPKVLQVGVWLPAPRSKSWEHRIAELMRARGFDWDFNPYPRWPKPHHDFDLVFASHHMGAPLAMHIAEREHAKFVAQVLDVPEFRLSGEEPWASNLRRYLGISLEQYRREWEEIGEALKKADLVISISNQTARDVEECFGISPVVNYLGVDVETADEFLAGSNPARFNQFCGLGLLYNHKRFDLLARVFSIIGEKLVIMGDGFMRSEIGKWGPVLTGAVTEREKFRVLSRSKALVHASINEGFCIPMAEALYSKTPVLAYRLPVLEEIYGDSINYWEDEDELIKGVERIKRDEPEGDREYVLSKGLTLQAYTNRLEQLLEEI